MQLISFDISSLISEKRVVLNTQGIPVCHGMAEIDMLYEEALSIYKELSEPKGIMQDITKKAFLEIYKGSGMNESPNPVENILNKDICLALFAFTLGEKICNKISSLIKEKDLPLGYMLDQVASRGAEKAADKAEQIFLDEVKKKWKEPDLKALLYSPGYCGWHVSAQQKLFQTLKPEKIGISLTESSLMQPIKSISGIIIAGDKSIHVFDNNYSFCKSCNTKNCRERIS